LRKARELTQRQLAERVDIDFTYLSKIENDLPDYRPSEKVIRALAAALKVDAEELVLLAEKLPKPMQDSFARNKAAHAFLRTTALAHLTDEDWAKLLQEAKRLGRRGKAK
jgi:HTH-type transcriptional regulator, competence development regulator